MNVRSVPCIRVPSLVPGRWVYLRGGDVMLGFVNRTWTTSTHNAVAFQDGTRAGAYIRNVPLAEWNSPQCDNLDAAIDVLEAHLASLGAEIVPDDEWPSGGDGEPHRPDRVPFRTEDYDAWYALRAFSEAPEKIGTDPSTT